MQRVVTYPKSSPVVRGLPACGMEGGVDNPPETSLCLPSAVQVKGKLQSC